MVDYCVLSGIICAAVLGAFPAMGAMQPVELKTEYREAPLGLGETTPRFTWRLVSEERNRVQTAYQILAADSVEALAADKGSLWDTGKTASDNSVLIAYEGQALRSRMQCWWKVRVWDNDDAVSDWSAPAFFSMGLLEEGDWRASWIGRDASANPDYDAAGLPSLSAAKWIWLPGGAPRESAPATHACFRRVVLLPEDAGIVNAHLLITGDDSVQAWVNDRPVGVGRSEMKDFHKVHQHLTAGLLKPGINVLSAMAVNKDGPAGFLAALRITLASGAIIDVYSDSAWKCSGPGAGPAWRTADFDDASWPSALEMAAFGESPWQDSAFCDAHLVPATQFRKSFQPRKDIRRAMVYATALGLYELHVNGERVGKDYFTPGWTDYRERVYYHAYDVTSMLRPGAENALGALLANGWYAGHVAHIVPGLYGKHPRLLVQLEIEYDDGGVDHIVTDGSWRAADGEIRGADLIMGEIRDKRKTLEGWDQPGYNDETWAAAEVLAPEIAPKRLQAYPGAPVRQFETLHAVKRTEPQPGVHVYDLGQNMVGWARIVVRGEAGQQVRVRHSEMLQDDGMIYTDALRAALAADLYHLAGGDPEVLEPSFTFHGFRYIEVRGVSAPPALEEVTGVVMHADAPITAQFECSNPLLNQLTHNIAWGLKGNYFEAPTDCPQRDERLGWTGDAQFFMPTALYTADIGAFFTKWLVDLVQDAQLEDGSFAHVAPDLNLGGGAVAWGDAALICPWLIYRFYGDARVIERHFDNMVRGMDFLERTSENHIRKQLGFGDWLNLGGGAKDEVICTAYYAYLAEIMSAMAEVIGRETEAKRYAELHDNIRDAFAAAFIDEEGRILESSQTGYALAFAFSLIPEPLRDAAAQHYVDEIARFDWHLATGFIGTPRLLPSLSLAKRDDVAYRLLMNTTYPSWLFQVTLGATTMWERWNGWTPDEGFASASMNSFNHYAFGAVGEWLFSRVAGIQCAEPGFRRIRIEPTPGGELSHARLAYNSIRGPIVSEWRLENGQFSLEVEIPANTAAVVRIPTKDRNSIREGGQPLEAVGIALSEDDNGGGALCELGSGVYRFTALSAE